MTEPNATPPENAHSPSGESRDDQGAALDRAAESIREAQDAEGTVASSDDITSRDAERAGEHSEDPGGEGGHP